MITTAQLDADWIRMLFNGFREGTIADALYRHHCRVALGECCIGDDMPGGHRYPTRQEIKDARRALVKFINRTDASGRPRLTTKAVQP